MQKIYMINNTQHQCQSSMIHGSLIHNAFLLQKNADSRTVVTK